MFGGEPYAGCVIAHDTHCVGSPALTVIVASFILPHCDEAETLTFTFSQISPYVCVYRQRYTELKMSTPNHDDKSHVTINNETGEEKASMAKMTNKRTLVSPWEVTSRVRTRSLLFPTRMMGVWG